MDLLTAGLIFLVAASASFAGGGVVRRGAMRAGAVVPPRPDRWHRRPTPTFGGIGIIAGLAAGSAAGGAFTPSAAPILAAVGALFVIGWYDDVAPLSALAKMVTVPLVGRVEMQKFVTTSGSGRAIK